LERAEEEEEEEEEEAWLEADAEEDLWRRQKSDKLGL
jgi:hypothetical protein